jgi:hypothetical protein
MQPRASPLTKPIIPSVKAIKARFLNGIGNSTPTTAITCDHRHKGVFFHLTLSGALNTLLAELACSGLKRWFGNAGIVLTFQKPDPRNSVLLRDYRYFRLYILAHDLAWCFACVKGIGIEVHQHRTSKQCEAAPEKRVVKSVVEVIKIYYLPVIYHRYRKACLNVRLRRHCFP